MKLFPFKQTKLFPLEEKLHITNYSKLLDKVI